MNDEVNSKLEKAIAELEILYEISIAMRTTLKLDEILFIILTGVTAHEGLGFNRAMLFLVNDNDRTLEGKLAIGPHSGEEAQKIWTQIEAEKKDLEDLISVYNCADMKFDSLLNQTVKYVKLPLEEKSGVLAMTVLEGMTFKITDDESRDKLDDPVLDMLKAKYFITVPLKSKDKVLGVILADNRFSGEPITNDDARMLSMFANHAGLAIENSRLYEKTLLLANRDYLTNLWNHRFFQMSLANEVEASKKQGSNLSLAMLDIDHFKNYNDALGHAAGDELLKQAAGVMRASFNDAYYICRYGGEEFSIIMPDTDKHSAYEMVDALRKKIEETNFAKKEIQPHGSVTISAGIATIPVDAAEKNLLISHADKALYHSKRHGRNQTSLYTSLM